MDHGKGNILEGLATPQFARLLKVWFRIEFRSQLSQAFPTPFKNILLEAKGFNLGFCTLSVLF
jgi:hypothetical protein